MQAYKIPGSGSDLGDCVESILRATPNPDHGPEEEVTVEYIVSQLYAVASNCRWSSPSVRDKQIPIDVEKSLADIYRRLSLRDAKWLTRLVLKDLSPAVLEPGVVYRAFHPLMPKILLVRDNIAEVSHMIFLLQRTNHCSKSPTKLLDYVTPRVVIKVGRQMWHEGRGIKHCLQLGHGRMSVEQKMDGEYCQVHIDLTKKARIQIFSKSDKDSTQDRLGVHDAILRSLGIGELDCSIQKRCIVDGELLVYSEKVFQRYKGSIRAGFSANVRLTP